MLKPIVPTLHADCANYSTDSAIVFACVRMVK